MKPNFALTFSSDSIGLLHRTARGWLEIGTTPFDAPDLPEALSYLRRSALGLAPHGVTSKLILPDDQILYLELEAPGPSVSAREGQIRRALEGRTPYDVADLVFDWVGEGRLVQVAVIARDTLAEAEAFAAEHRFNPVSLVAYPDPARFAGEPWFGATALAATLLPPGEAVERDAEPLRVVTRQARAEAAAAVLAQAAPVVPVESEPEAETAPETAPEPELAPELWQEPEPLPDQPLVAEAAFQADLASDLPSAMVGVQAEDMVLPEPEPEPELSVEEPNPVAMTELPPEPLAAPLADLPPEPDLALPEVSVPELPMAEAAPEPAPLQAAFDLDAPAAMQAPALDAVLPRGPEVIPPVTTPPRRAKRWTPPPEPGDDEPDLRSEPQPEPEAAPAPVTPDPAFPTDLLARALGTEIPPMPEAPFIAVEEGDDLEFDPLEVPSGAPQAGPRLAVTSVTPHRRAPTAPLIPPITVATAPEARPYDPQLEAPVPAPDAEEAAPLLPGGAKPAPLAAPARPGKAPATKGAAPKPVPAKAMAAKAPAKAVGALAGLAKAKAGKPAAAATTTLVAAPPADTQATAATALRGRPDMRRGKPRYLGLVLTGLLLLALAVIGAWSSITLSRLNSTPDPAVEQTDLAALPVEALPADPAENLPADTLPVADLPSPDDEAAADGEMLPDETALAMAAIAPEPAPEAVLEPAGDPAAATTSPAPVQLSGEQDEIFLSSKDAQPQAADALALPPAQAVADALPAPAVPPPPFGTQYEFGADGLILPTPEGIVTPDGLRLVAGPPPKKPPPRPAAIAALANAPAAAIAAPQPAPEAVPQADPRLQGFRPRPRPEGLRAPGADDAALEIPAEKRMASLRPRARPAALAEAAATRAEQAARQAAQDEAARSAAAAASLSASATAAQPGAEALPQGEDATAEAIAAAVAPRAGPISPQAVAISRHPPKKPRDFNRRVQAAVAAAAAPAARAKPAEPEPEAPSRSAARNAEPGEDEEPTAPAARAPKVPTKASVAKNATFANAINLGKTNLIGVYGTPSKRYALVRLGSGQYKKVRVGDRVDGGTVAAITESEVRYKKGGRMVALAMPRG